MKYVITFPSVTMCLKTDLFLDTIGITTKEVTPIPYNLSNTCYGLGISLETDDIQSIASQIKDNELIYRHIWHDVNEDGNYIKIDRGDSDV